jgi:hypothetical protein
MQWVNLKKFVYRGPRSGGATIRQNVSGSVPFFGIKRISLNRLNKISVFLLGSNKEAISPQFEYSPVT